MASWVVAHEVDVIRVDVICDSERGFEVPLLYMVHLEIAYFQKTIAAFYSPYTSQLNQTLLVSPYTISRR